MLLRSSETIVDMNQLNRRYYFDLDELQMKGIVFTNARNAEKIKVKNMDIFNVAVGYRKLWNGVVDEEDRRIEPMKKGRYQTHWRKIKDAIDHLGTARSKSRNARALRTLCV